jgi:hypothetical protein
MVLVCHLLLWFLQCRHHLPVAPVITPVITLTITPTIDLTITPTIDLIIIPTIVRIIVLMTVPTIVRIIVLMTNRMSNHRSPIISPM